MKSIFKSVITSILTKEASWLLKRHKPTIIAITGSVGKTTTKDAIYAAIKGSVSARKSEKSFNSEIGVPLTILGLSNGWNNPVLWLKNIIDGFMTALFSKEYPSVLVLETGIDRPKDMERLVKWLKPDIAVLTRLPSVPVHVEFFSSPEEVVKEKMKLVDALPTDGVLIYNHDDEVIKEQLENVLQRRVGYSRYLASDYTAAADKFVYSDDRPVATEFTVRSNAESAVVRVAGTVGSHQVYSGTAALAVAATLQIPLTEAAASLSNLRPPNGRLRVIPGLKATTIIDDTYNSSPIAAEQALQTLKELKYAKRKIAVLGDMLELGRYSTEAHEKVGARAVETADILITVGVRSRGTAEAALEHGMSEKYILRYDEAGRAGRELQNLIQPGDVILIKGSQGMRMERIVQEIMAEPDRVEELLVRQDRAWSYR